MEASAEAQDVVPALPQTGSVRDVQRTPSGNSHVRPKRTMSGTPMPLAEEPRRRDSTRSLFSTLNPTAAEGVEGKPMNLDYPELSENPELTLGSGVYFHPAVTLKKQTKAPLPAVHEIMQSFDSFVQQAHEFSELFGGPAKLDPMGLKRIWDETKNGSPADRIDLAIATFLLKGIPDTQESTYFDDFNRTQEAQKSKWKSARGVFFSQRMKGITAKKLQFSVEPALPVGLVLSSRTGVISGKPAAVSPKQIYTVKCLGEGDDAHACEAKLTIAVSDLPPKNLKYPKVENNVVLTGQPVSWAPEIEGTVNKWSARESFPAGMTLDPLTGVICGVATQSMQEKTYTVIAKNDQGTTSAQVQFRVMRPAPMDLTYHETTPGVGGRRGLCGNSSAVFYPLNRWLRLYPSVEGEVDEYSINPELPAGLDFDATTGVISGTPSVTTTPKRYKVMASNETGNVETTLMFEIKVVQTESLTYEQVDETYTVGETVTLEPELVGTAVEWTVEPPLPPGLQLDPQSGKISGTPTEVCEERSYTVAAAASSDGGTSCVLTFAVLQPVPKGLTYQGAAADYTVNQVLQLEPELSVGLATTYAVVPPLPEGLTLEESSGVISGKIAIAAARTNYIVTASGSGGSCEVMLTFMVKEARQEKRMSTVDDEFSVKVENIVDLAEMPAEPPKDQFSRHWMIWMVHRVQLDDPTLTKFSFNNVSMPLPKDEPRVSPKLMRAVAVNTHITELDLSHSNLRPQEGMQLATSLRCNGALQSVNVDGNHLNQDAIYELAMALVDSPTVTSWSCQGQMGMGAGATNTKRVEQAVANLATENSRITKLGFQFRDEHLSNMVDAAIRRNRDALRRRRKKSVQTGRRVEEKQFSELILSMPPEQSVKEFFPDDSDENMAFIRQHTADKGRVPTREQLQAIAKREGRQIKYAQVAPLVRSFRKVLLDALVGMQVIASDDSKATYEGQLAEWSEKNECWSVTIHAPQEDVMVQYHLSSRKDIVIKIADDVKIWLWQ